MGDKSPRNKEKRKPKKQDKKAPLVAGPATTATAAKK